MLEQIVDDSEGADKGLFEEQDAWKHACPTSALIERDIRAQVNKILAYLREPDFGRSFFAVEKCLIPLVLALGRLFFAFYLAWRHQHSGADLRFWQKKGYSFGSPQPRLLGTTFGKVRYWRTYMTDASSAGIYPLDLALRLTADGFSMHVITLAARMASRMSYDHVVEILRLFLLWSPSKSSVEKAVMGLGKYTEDWFLNAPPPEGDGEVLVTQIDSKAIPTATEEELGKRRGKRPENPYPGSQRHRGRVKRQRRGSKKRRAEGDKSKNGKAAHVVVQYTLKKAIGPDGKPVLLGPINRKSYGTHVSKRRAFLMARHLADKRGFAENSGKTHQFVGDGDEDLARLKREYLPEAVQTLDVMHVIEYLWEAGRLIFKDDRGALVRWIKRMKKLLYGGEALQMAVKIAAAAAAVPKTGPGNKQKGCRLGEIRDYIFKRVDQMNYQWLRGNDLEIASGSVEGAVNHLVAIRFDKGGMRWIKERAQALLQLRCIDQNREWELFTAFVHDQVSHEAMTQGEAQRILSIRPAPLEKGSYNAALSALTNVCTRTPCPVPKKSKHELLFF